MVAVQKLELKMRNLRKILYTRKSKTYRAAIHTSCQIEFTICLPSVRKPTAYLLFADMITNSTNPFIDLN